jgi:hypothetical protein
VWLGASLVLTAGCVAGLALGGVAAWLIGHFVQQRTGLALAVAIGLPEVISIVGLIVVVSLLALLPASVSFRAPVGDALR